MKRVRDRDEKLSAMEDLDDIHNQMNNPNFMDPGEVNNDLRMITEKDEELLDQYFSANQRAEMNELFDQKEGDKSQESSDSRGNLDRVNSDISQGSGSIEKDLEHYDYKNYKPDENIQNFIDK